jgi:hypothetical protein
VTTWKKAVDVGIRHASGLVETFELSDADINLDTRIAKGTTSRGTRVIIAWPFDATIVIERFD